MKVLFELKVTQPTGNVKRHGGGRYGEIVLSRIIELGLPVCCSYDSRLWFNPLIKNMLDSNNVKLYDLSKRNFEDIIKTEDIDLVYVPTNVSEEHLKIRACSVLGTIHGLRTMETPIDSDEMYYKPFGHVLKYLGKKMFTKLYYKYKGKFIKNAVASDTFHFVTVSNHSAASFKVFFPECQYLDIPVFYSPSTSNNDVLEKKYSQKYFLLVSANRSYKNNLRAIKALDKLFFYGYLDDYSVKITGAEDPGIFRYKLMNQKKFDFVGFVDERELDQLYHDAYCFIYPTLNEGFGYPPLEAMHYGVPVLSSPFTSIPEVCGGNVLYFNPFSIEEIMNRILQILDPQVHDKYSRLAKEGYEVVKKKQDEDLDKLVDYIYNFG